MREWFASKEGKKIKITIYILCSILLVQIIGSLYFSQTLYDISLKNSKKQVEELSAYVEKSFQLELEQYIHTLEITALEVEKEYKTFSPNLIEKLKTIQDISNFNIVGISDLHGNGIDTTGNKQTISYELMQEQFEQNKVYISNLWTQKNETLIFVAVPLQESNKIYGMIWGKIPIENIINNIKFSDDSYNYFRIVDHQGKYLFSSKSKFAFHLNPKENDHSIWDELDDLDYKGGMSVEELRNNISKRESGTFYFEYDGKIRYIGYCPLKINNWYLFTVQVEDQLNSYVNHTRSIAVLFFIVLTIVLISIFTTLYHLVYTMYQNITKHHHELRTINGMFRAILQQTNNIPFTIERRHKQVILYGYPTKDIVQYCSFADMLPENMLKKGIIDTDNLQKYQELYESIIVQGKKCNPVILYSRVGEKKEWIRVRLVSDTQNQGEQMIGVLESYNEQKEKDLQIENHLDDIRKFEQKSQIDFLTGLYNREAFIEKMQKALYENYDQQHRDAFLILDLDHFKDVNDCMGHAMGDVVLQKTAETLRSFFRKKDIVGRLGGDEFVVFAPNIEDVKAFEQRIKQLNTLLYKVYSKEEKSVQISASIGIMLTDPQHTSFHALYEKADKALYQVKQRGRNGYHIYRE